MGAVKHRDDSFCRLVIWPGRIQSAVEKLAVWDVGNLMSTLVKFIILGNSSSELRTFFVEYEVASLTLEDF